MDLLAAMSVSASGMRAQSARIKAATENIANANSFAADGTGAYKRQVVYLQASPDKKTGLTSVQVTGIKRDQNTPTTLQYDPSNPMANAQGYVEKSNVDTQIEAADMREAARAYEANISAIETAKQMMSSSLNLLR